MEPITRLNPALAGLLQEIIDALPDAREVTKIHLPAQRRRNRTTVPTENLAIPPKAGAPVDPDKALQDFLKSAKEQCTNAALPDGRMDAKTAAAYLGLSPKTLANMRTLGTGPQFLKLGKIYYYKADLDEWIAAHGRVSSTAQARLPRPDPN